MRHPWPWAMFAALVVAVPAARTQELPGFLGVGDHVPELRCKDATGRKLSWNEWPGRAVILFFHAPRMEFSRRGLEQVLVSLQKETELLPDLGFLLVVSGEGDIDRMTRLLAGLGINGRVVMDPQRREFPKLHVVAFPTVFCIGRDRRIAHIAKGFGPLFSTRVTVGARYGAGRIDRETLEKSLSARVGTSAGEQYLRRARTLRMARQLMAAGMIDEAHDALAPVLDPGSDSEDGVQVMARLLLRMGKVEEARRWVGRYGEISSDPLALRLLEAEVAVASGDSVAALKALEGFDDTMVRVAWLRGRAHQLVGDHEKAARLFRKALESVLEQGPGGP